MIEIFLIFNGFGMGQKALLIGEPFDYFFFRLRNKTKLNSKAKIRVQKNRTFHNNQF